MVPTLRSKQNSDRTMECCEVVFKARVRFQSVSFCNSIRNFSAHVFAATSYGLHRSYWATLTCAYTMPGTDMHRPIASTQRFEHHHRVADGCRTYRVGVRMALVASEHDDVARTDPPHLAGSNQIDRARLAREVLARSRRVGNTDEPSARGKLEPL